MAEAKTVEVRTVTMQDGTVVEFAGKSRMKKTGLVQSDGSLTLRVDFEDGTVRTYDLNAKLVDQYALHGASQKFGDEVAGLKSEDGSPAPIEDFISEMDQLDARLNGEGIWTTERKVGVGGGGMLAKALAEISGQTPAQITGFLAKLDAKQKAAMKKDSTVAGIIARLEAEKAAKLPPSTIATDLIASLKAS